MVYFLMCGTIPSEICSLSNILQVLPLFAERLLSLEQCLMDVGQGAAWPPLSILPVYLIGVVASVQVWYYVSV